LESQGCHTTKGGFPVSNGHFDYCSTNCKCDYGEGDCDLDDECSNNGICRVNVGRLNDEDYLFGYDVCSRRKTLGRNTDGLPLILIHGHSPLHGSDTQITARNIIGFVYQKANELTSTVEGQSIFGKYGYFDQYEGFKNNVEGEGYYDFKGYVTGLDIIEAEKYCKLGSWGKNIIVKTTYYMDEVQCKDNNCYVMSDTEGISEYAKRLKKSIDVVKKCTGSSKVNIIAHSMGGLVSRKYIQDGGYDSVSKLIMLGTPNKGINENIGLNKYCEDTHAGMECSNMKKDSDFITKLNSKEMPSSVTYYTIAGTSEGTNDGTVEVESVHIGNNNLNVACSHGDLIEPSKCPKAYTFIKTILAGKDASSNVETKIDDDNEPTSSIKETTPESKNKKTESKPPSTTTNNQKKSSTPNDIEEKKEKSETKKTNTQPIIKPVEIVEIIKSWFNRWFK
jgi:hypothetical protein